MDIFIDLAILIVICCMSVMLLRAKLRVCPHCASLLLDRPLSGVHPSHARASERREPSPFADVAPRSEPSPFLDLPLPYDPHPFWDTPLMIAESADDFVVIETHVPVAMPTPPASHTTTPPQIRESGAILIEPKSEDEVDLRPVTDAPQADEDAGAGLMLEKDIGLGPKGLPLASRLIDAGFGVAMTTPKWGRGGRRRQLANEIDDC